MFGRKSWKVRYFVLSRGVLNYYTDKKAYQKSEPALGSFHVLQITSIKTMPEKDKKFSNQSHREFVFPTRKLVVCCDSEAILQKWVDAINAHVRAERGAGQAELEEEIGQVEMEARRQITFNILLNVLKRWVTVDWARAVASWKLNRFVDQQCPVPEGSVDLHRLRAELEREKEAEFAEFAEALKHKWETALNSLKKDVSELKQDNAKLSQQNKELRKQHQHQQPPAPSADTVEVRRSEFLELMEAAAYNSLPQQDSEAIAALQHQLAESQAAVAQANREAAGAAREAAAAKHRVEALQRQLQARAQHSELGETTGDPQQAALREVLASRATSPAPRIPPKSPPKSPPQSPPQAAGHSSWISRYKAIVNTEF